jgi:signal transduction histidine kinase
MLMGRADCSRRSRTGTMSLRFGSFKTRTALANALAVALILVANGFYLLLAERAELERTRETLEEHASAFARLTAISLGRAFEREHGRFQEVARSYMSLEPALERIRILSPAGDLLFDSTRAAEERLTRPAEPDLLDAARRPALQKLQRRAHGAALDAVEVVVPYFSEAGEHSLSLAYRVSFASLDPALRRRYMTTLWLMIVSVLAALLVAAVLASRITRPIQELTRGALEIGEGSFDRRLDVGGDDEIRILADTLNQMAARLKENIEKLEESNKRLAGMNEELKELDRMKSDLLANVSHELRTPLTAIKGYTDYILEGKLGPIGERQEKGLIVVQRNLERLSRSINALLDFSTMDVGRLSLNLQPFALPLLVEQIHQTLRSELERKRLRFEAALAPGLPSVIADRERLAQVLENLVINAIKFTPADGRIKVSATREERQGKGVVEVGVSDTGIGIPEDQLGRIFNRFHQVDGSSTRRYGGVGLGLAIVRSILDAHGANIKVESGLGSGTSFRFWLPISTRDEAQPPSHPGYP